MCFGGSSKGGRTASTARAGQASQRDVAIERPQEARPPWAGGATPSQPEYEAQNRTQPTDEGRLRIGTRNARSKVANTNVDSRRKAKRGSSLRIGNTSGVSAPSDGSGVSF